MTVRRLLNIVYEVLLERRRELITDPVQFGQSVESLDRSLNDKFDNEMTDHERFIVEARKHAEASGAYWEQPGMVATMSRHGMRKRPA
jgi:hypothetical protein